MVYRIYVEKKPDYAVKAHGLKQELVMLLGVSGLENLRIVHRYDVEGISRADFDRSVPVVFSEPPIDEVFETVPSGDYVLAVEFLPGQFDQRADSAAECIQLLCGGERPAVASATIYVMDGDITPAQRDAIEHYLINPVEARRASMDEKTSLEMAYEVPTEVEILDGFRLLQEGELQGYIEEYGLAMDTGDLALCREYFVSEDRDPTITELRMLDTYWSDHCRHTTFLTELDNISIADPKVQKSYEMYLDLRSKLGRQDKPVTLMDIATIGAKALKAKGLLDNLDESEEVNACSIKVMVDNNGADEEWLLLFKNETHNHPTEIEPFGGASTCLGGAIRDPLSGRGYVYQAMRVTGAGDPLTPISETLPGKLPQRKITTTAAAGYASYGNQIGLAAGQISEIYHPGYVAKRMELGAVLGAVPYKNVRRETPQPGDAVILIGGRTGRDGCGGATGSSKAHDQSSLEKGGAEVQKGNPPIERRLQRLFRKAEVTTLIKRCNDFGAGGVSVAVGELADSLDIDLNAVPKKYEGLDGTELAISESQERMAVVVADSDAARFIEMAEQENLEATVIAKVTDTGRLCMRWNGKTIVDISRDFINTNGAKKTAGVQVLQMPEPVTEIPNGTLEQRLTAVADDLNGCLQKGLSERFDSTIGAATVLMPFGGKRQLTPIQAMVAKLPVLGETTTCSGMAYGYDPYISEQNPYDGAYLAVVESVAKLAASGLCRKDMYLTFQEFFERLRNEPVRWGKPFSALLGALQAQMDLELAAVGGKDSMSGSFEDLDVPPTLVSFAVAPGDASRIVSPEFKQAGSRVALLKPATYDGPVPEGAAFRDVLEQLEKLMDDNKVLSVRTPGRLGVAHALIEMGAGNGIGMELDGSVKLDDLFVPAYGSFIVELAPESGEGITLGMTTEEYSIQAGGESADLNIVQQVWTDKLSAVFPFQMPSTRQRIPTLDHHAPEPKRKTVYTKTARPRALVTVFPGTNCEYDTARALERAGAEADVFIIRNLTPDMVTQSAAELARRIDQSQMVVIPGGFSGGDEPEGSAKLINAFFRGAAVSESVARLLEQRDGLMLGICNGFQALIKLGLLPHGRITEIDADSPTLTFNTIGRHQSMLVDTRICSNLSPWLMHEEVGSVHTIAVSHGEGRFVCTGEMLDSLIQNGQVAAQYVDLGGNPAVDVRYNPNGSLFAIEGISSPDGRVLGKMGHSERSGGDLYKNVPGNQYQKLFEGGVDYFK